MKIPEFILEILVNSIMKKVKSKYNLDLQEINFSDLR